ncbi:type II toxin-antitoxin system VapB family antitoxin [uncultured Sphingomonas sp.]|uniref:type II toxin-antitoxin system VapB family antitoxin n=1 Tax=uncultured Sphingomonas sp. TaxID=158754 RepID=UPI0035CA6DF0
MATQLNIKDAETVRLVRQYAQETGRSVTATVRTAIENDRRAHEADIVERMLRLEALVAEVRADMPEEWRDKSSKEIMDSMYDDEQPDGFAV